MGNTFADWISNTYGMDLLKFEDECVGVEREVILEAWNEHLENMTNVQEDDEYDDNWN